MNKGTRVRATQDITSLTLFNDKAARLMVPKGTVGKINKVTQKGGPMFDGKPALFKFYVVSFENGESWFVLDKHIEEVSADA